MCGFLKEGKDSGIQIESHNKIERYFGWGGSLVAWRDITCTFLRVILHKGGIKFFGMQQF